MALPAEQWIKILSTDETFAPDCLLWLVKAERVRVPKTSGRATIY
jgi:hypothetical protein